MTQGTNRRWQHAALFFILAWTGCGTSTRQVTVSKIENLRSQEALLPLATDSIVERYRRNSPEEFYRAYTPRIEELRLYVDSLNTYLDPSSMIDTLAIDHTFENLGTAARIGKTIHLSSSYFFMFDDPTVIRSVVTHEFGHIHYDHLTPFALRELADIWEQMRGSALFYLFRDGEYSGNARFGGHPDESPEELFASAFNLFNNKSEELGARFRYVDQVHLELVERLRDIVHSTGSSR
ncbi:MAG: hypothetical protein ACKVRP_05845 [Bacteroidota bacterium]